MYISFYINLIPWKLFCDHRFHDVYGRKQPSMLLNIYKN